MKNLNFTDFTKLKGIQLSWKKIYISMLRILMKTRIVLKSNNAIEEYEFENKNNLNFKNNIYLGTISRVEPSLQAAFVNFGRERHGFLAFNDIQSDYYQIPSEDKERIKIAEEQIREELKNKNINISQENSAPDENSDENSSDLKENGNLTQK